MAPRGISRFGVEFMVVCLYLSIDFWEHWTESAKLWVKALGTFIRRRDASLRPAFAIDQPPLATNSSTPRAEKIRHQ